MFERNSLPEFRERLVLSGGIVLWENVFTSWNKEDQLEMIAYFRGFIIYAQTDLGFMQPPWIAFEHDFSYGINEFASRARSYHIKKRDIHTHTVFQIYPRGIFKFLKGILATVEVHSSFLEIPDYKLFNFLNRVEVAKYYGNEEKTVEIVLNKMRDANLSEYVPKIMFQPEPIYYEI